PTPSDDVNCLYAEERYLFYCSSRSFQLKRSELTGLSSSHTDGKRKESVVEADRGLAQIAVDKQVRVAGERPPQLQRQLRILGFEFVQRLGSEDHEFDGAHGLLSRQIGRASCRERDEVTESAGAMQQTVKCEVMVY